MSKKKSAGFDRMSKLADSDDVFEDTFTLKKGKKRKRKKRNRSTMLTPIVQEFIKKVWDFLKEIFMFGVDAFMIAAAREIGKRFMERLKQKGGAIESESKEQQKQIPAYAGSSGQRTIPFLDEYRD